MPSLCRSTLSDAINERFVAIIERPGPASVSTPLETSLSLSFSHARGKQELLHTGFVLLLVLVASSSGARRCAPTSWDAASIKRLRPRRRINELFPSVNAAPMTYALRVDVPGSARSSLRSITEHTGKIVRSRENDRTWWRRRRKFANFGSRIRIIRMDRIATTRRLEFEIESFLRIYIYKNNGTSSNGLKGSSFGRKAGNAQKSGSARCSNRME